MSSSYQEDSYVLSGSDARDWYMSRRGGGNLLDAHISAIINQFGPQVSYTLRAPVDPIDGYPTILIIEIETDASDAWQTLDAVENELLNQRDTLSERSRRKNPFSNIAITLKPNLENWEAAREEIERME